MDRLTDLINRPTPHPTRRFKPSVWFPAAELGDPANHLVLNSTGGPEDPFSKTALMISTGDAETVRVCMWVGAFLMCLYDDVGGIKSKIQYRFSYSTIPQI